MNVSLTPELERFVAKEVKTGLYQTASEVIRAGLRRLKEDQELRPPKFPNSLADLESQLVRSIDQLDAGRGLSGKAVLRRLQSRTKESRD